MVIMHNLEAMNANRMFGVTNSKLASTTEKLSSGYKINRSADDAAGLSISEKMRRQIRGLNQASLNAQDGISMVQVADGAMAEVMEMLQRGNELSVKAANGTLTEMERQFIQDEIDHLKDEIDGISDRTKFNDLQVLKGVDVPRQSAPGGAAIISGLPGWVGLGSSTAGLMGDTYTTTEAYEYTDTTSGNQVTGTAQIQHTASILDFSDLNDPAQLVTKLNELKGQGFYSTCCTCTNHYSIKFTDGSTNSMEQSGNHYIYNIGVDGVQNASELVQRMVDGTENGNPQGHFSVFEQDVNNASRLVIYDDRDKGEVAKNIGNGASVTWTDWDYGNTSNVDAYGDYGRFGPGIAVSEQSLQRDNPVNIILQIGGEKGETMGIDLPSISTISVGIDTVDVTTHESAGAGINAFRDAIDYVSRERARMGSYQNRLEHTIKSLDNVSENTQAAESRIRDTDMADTMVANANLNVLAQAGQSMLAQANKSKEGILSLLG